MGNNCKGICMNGPAEGGASKGLHYREASSVSKHNVRLASQDTRVVNNPDGVDRVDNTDCVHILLQWNSVHGTG